MGRQEIADYAKVSVRYVSAMKRAGLRVLAGYRCKRTDIDRFFEERPCFRCRHTYNTEKTGSIRMI